MNRPEKELHFKSGMCENSILYVPCGEINEQWKQLNEYCNALEKRCSVLEKAFELSCNHASCQFMKIEDEWCEHTEERNYEEDCLKCLRTHFLKEAEGNG